MTRVIHTGDTHLGYRQYHRSERREDFLAAFRQVVEDAIEDDVDGVVHAGDLFHDRRPDLPDLLGTLSVLRDLDEAGVPFLAIVGNHETKRDAQWLDLFASLGLATRLGREPTVVGDTAFYGLDFVPRSQRDDLDYRFEPHDATHAALVAHGLFAPLAPDFENDPWDIRDVMAAATVEFDAVLLGDDHRPKRRELEGTWVTYCGSTERTSADERAERGYNIVEFDGEAGISRRGIPTREFVYVDVELAEEEGVSRVREQVGQHDLKEAVVVVTIDGEGEPVAPAHVEEFVSQRGSLVARVTDRRKATEDEEIEVSFADPDEAVRERVRKLGLSPAARGIDEAIRASKTPDSRIADTVQERVRELVDTGEFDAFEPAPHTDPEVEAETAAERIADRSDDGARPADDEAADGTEPAAAEGAKGSATSVGTGEPTSVEETDGSTQSEKAGEPGAAETAGDTSEGGEGQASMEDYL